MRLYISHGYSRFKPKHPKVNTSYHVIKCYCGLQLQSKSIREADKKMQEHLQRVRDIRAKSNREETATVQG